MKTIEEMIAVMQAAKEGKKIEVYDSLKQIWIDAEHPCWDWDAEDYRVKPEPKYRPYANSEECFKDVRKHGGWIAYGGTQYRQITGIGHGCNPNLVKINGCNWMKFEELIQADWADDGSPCGVLEE